MVMKAIGKYKLLVFAALATMLLQVGAALWQPQYMKNILSVMAESISISDKVDKINHYGVYLLLIAAVGLIGSILNTVTAAKIAQSVSADIREETFRKIQTFSYENIEKFNAGNLVVRMTNDIRPSANTSNDDLPSLDFRVPLLFIGAFILSIITMPELWWSYYCDGCSYCFSDDVIHEIYGSSLYGFPKIDGPYQWNCQRKPTWCSCR